MRPVRGQSKYTFPLGLVFDVIYPLQDVWLDEVVLTERGKIILVQRNRPVVPYDVRITTMVEIIGYIALSGAFRPYGGHRYNLHCNGPRMGIIGAFFVVVRDEIHRAEFLQHSYIRVG